MYNAFDSRHSLELSKLKVLVVVCYTAIKSPSVCFRCAVIYTTCPLVCFTKTLRTGTLWRNLHWKIWQKKSTEIQTTWFECAIKWVYQLKVLSADDNYVKSKVFLGLIHVKMWKPYFSAAPEILCSVVLLVLFTPFAVRWLYFYVFLLIITKLFGGNLALPF